MVRNALIQNILNIQLSTVETEALQFGLEFDTGVNNLNIVNLININFKYNNSDSNKGIIQGLITATTNINTDDYALPRTHIAALRILS